MIKRGIPWIILTLAAFWLLSSMRPPVTHEGDFNLNHFGKIPVLVGGRVKPLDTVGRNALVILHGKQSLRLEGGKTLDSMHWLTDVLFNAPVADKYPVFVIHNPEVLGLFGWQQDDRKYFSFAELTPFLNKIDEQGSQAGDVESVLRTPYQTAVFNLRNALILYQRLKNSLQPEDATEFADEIDAYALAVPSGLEEAQKQQRKEKFDKEKLEAPAKFKERYTHLEESAYILPVPPAKEEVRAVGEWLSVGGSLLKLSGSDGVNPIVQAYARMGDAYRANNPDLFNQHVEDLAEWMKEHEPRSSGRSAYEFWFNQMEPFYHSMTLYVLAFLLVCGFWLGGNTVWSRSAFLLLLLALVVHSFGLISRMYLQGRPPVTNLYSSAIFIGWGTVIIGLILERIFKDGIGSACAAAIGFITLIIAHHLAGSGDTLEMLQAVLDTNIWLATHVVVITIGYSAMFFAGMLAILYVVRGVFTNSLTKEAAASLARMTYGVVCFATLFSFVGTVLGGIWADQSWGRFWGWDPKENGALLIVLWCAIILHARWAGLIRQRGLMIMALFGNVITSFSWFGVNMLGVGLHSYGFMDKALPWLVGFMVSQLLLMALAAVQLGRKNLDTAVS